MCLQVTQSLHSTRVSAMPPRKDSTHRSTLHAIVLRSFFHDKHISNDVTVYTIACMLICSNFIFWISVIAVMVNYCTSTPTQPSNTQSSPFFTRTIGSTLTYSCANGYTAGVNGVPVFTCTSQAAPLPASYDIWSSNGGSCVCKFSHYCILVPVNFSSDY